jgi:hypothetical protein
VLFLALPAWKIQGLNPEIDLQGRKVGLNYQNNGSLTYLDTRSMIHIESKTKNQV